MDEARDQPTEGHDPPAGGEVMHGSSCRPVANSEFAAALARAADRVDRRRRAPSAAIAWRAMHCDSMSTPDTVPLDVTLEKTWDPREDEDWFQRLPVDVQRQLRAEWKRQASRFDHVPKQNRRRLLKSMVEGAAIWAAAAVVQAILVGFAGQTLLVMAGAGAVAGLIWHVARAERFVHATISLAIYFPLHIGTFGQVMGGDAFGCIPLFYGAVIVAWASAIRGQRKEFAVLEGSY